MALTKIVSGGHTGATVPVSDKSIAVLPFVDMSEKKTRSTLRTVSPKRCSIS